MVSFSSYNSVQWRGALELSGDDWRCLIATRLSAELTDSHTFNSAPTEFELDSRREASLLSTFSSCRHDKSRRYHRRDCCSILREDPARPGNPRIGMSIFQVPREFQSPHVTCLSNCAFVSPSTDMANRGQGEQGSLDPLWVWCRVAIDRARPSWSRTHR